MRLRNSYVCVAVCLVACLVISRSGAGQQGPARRGNPAPATKIIFDQNDPSFYGASAQKMAQFPSPDNAIPYGKFAVFVGLQDERGKIVDALEPKPQARDNLRTGYYIVPNSSARELNTFGVVINADDPNNRHDDISYVMPCVWFSSVTWPHERILKPWVGFDSLEYAVDLRVPFANSPNIYHSHVIDDDESSERRPDFAAPYVLGGLYFEQLKRLGGTQRPPAFWIAVTLFDLRKHFARETLIVDKWSGGTNYPIVYSTVGREVAPDDRKPLPDVPPLTPMPMSIPTYTFTLPDSESMLSESSEGGPFRHFAFRVTKENFLAAIDEIKSRLSMYGEHGTAPMSSDPADWGLTFFNLDAEIFHNSTLPKPPPADQSRAMMVEFRNLRIIQASRSPKTLTAHGALENVDGVYVQGFACFDVDASDPTVSPEQLSSLRETPVSVEISAVDASHSREVPLGRISARLPIQGSAATCGTRRNGHSFKYQVPLDRIVRIAESGRSMFISARAVLGSGKSVPLQDPPAGPLQVPNIDLRSYARGLTGRFDAVKDRTALGSACIPGKEDAIPIDILVKPRMAIQGDGMLVAHGYADMPPLPGAATSDTCASKGAHTFMITLPSDLTLDDGQTLVAVARPGNYVSPSPTRPWDLQLPQADPLTTRLHLDPPLVKGYFEIAKNRSGESLQIRGWACVVGAQLKLRVKISGVTNAGQNVPLKTTIADRASEAAVQSECQVFNSAGNPEVRPDGNGFRFDVTFDARDLAPFGGTAGISDIRVEAERGTGSQDPVRIPKVPGSN